MNQYAHRFRWLSMQVKENTAPIESHFGSLNNPRHHNKKHKRLDIIVIAICTTICGADTFDQIADFGRSKINWCNGFWNYHTEFPLMTHSGEFLQSLILKNENSSKEA